MAQIDYKIPHVRIDNDKTTVTVRFYGGDITTEDEFDDNARTMKPVTRYRRKDGLLKEEIFVFAGELSDAQIEKELNKKLKEYADTVGRTTIPSQTDAQI